MAMDPLTAMTDLLVAAQEWKNDEAIGIDSADDFLARVREIMTGYKAPSVEDLQRDMKGFCAVLAKAGISATDSAAAVKCSIENLSAGRPLA